MTKDEFYASDRKSLREWLQKNHAISMGIWLVYNKRNEAFLYNDIVEELLCFGWIDSVTRTKNALQTMQYISPRKPKSPWSKSNKIRIEKLLHEKLTTKPGLAVIERAKKDGSWSSYDAVESLTIPDDLMTALSQNKTAEKNFSNFSKSTRKQLLWHVLSAKQEETRKKRIERVIVEAARNNNPLEYKKSKK